MARCCAIVCPMHNWPISSWPRSTGLPLAAVLAIAAVLPACQPQDQQAGNGANEATDKKPLPTLPIVEPPFDRARILLAVARAASAHSIGTDDLAAQRKLDGKQFEVRLRFGCEGQGPGRGDHGWSVDPDGRTLRLRAVASLSLGDEGVASLAGEGVEAVEGFWLPRPWLLTADCPAKEAAAGASEDGVQPDERPDTRTTGREGASSEPSAIPVQRVGIARYFTREDSRTGRRIDRPFEAVVQLKEGERPGTAGFNLVLGGRLRASRDGRVIQCTGSGRDRPPDCIVSADIDRVWIERPGEKRVLAEWTN